MAFMKHAETNHIAELPDLPYWRAAGWEPTDERPAEPDPLRDPPEAIAGAETTETPDADAPTPTKKSAAAAKKQEADRG